MRAPRLAVLISLVLYATLAAPLQARSAPAVSGDYIVVFRDSVGDAGALAGELAARHGFRPTHVYEHALKGFAASLPAAAVDALERNPSIAWVEPDGTAYPIGEQSNATWGLDRIDQRDSTLNGTYVYDTTGAGVTAYVIDSGIRYTHDDFDQVVNGFDATGGDGVDCNGHGTHVAGTIGGTEWGVAKDVTLISVRVFGCSGGSSWSVVIAGVDWVTGHHAAGQPAVANMSLGGGGNSSVDAAVRNSIADGISYAVAAGNGNFIGREDDACKYSPARVTEAMTIGATDRTDTKASWSNYGDCVDWFAPGVGVTSAWIDSDTDTHTISGTSMATPHTAGVAALYLDANGGASPQVVRDAIYAATTKDIVKSSRTANDHLLFNLRSEGGGGGDTNSAPVANDDAATTTEGTAITVAVLANDTDADNDALSVTSLTQPASGTAVLNADGTVTYTPNPDFTGTDGFTYAAHDGEAVSEPATVTITVEPDDTGGGGDGDVTTFAVTLAPSNSSQGRTWTAIVTITAATNDDQPDPVDGVAVTGVWSDGTEMACTTGDSATGECQVQLPGIRKNVTSVTFTVTSVDDTVATSDWDGTLPPPVTVLKP